MAANMTLGLCLPSTSGACLSSTSANDGWKGAPHASEGQNFTPYNPNQAGNSIAHSANKHRIKTPSERKSSMHSTRVPYSRANAASNSSSSPLDAHNSRKFGTTKNTKYTSRCTSPTVSIFQPDAFAVREPAEAWEFDSEEDVQENTERVGVLLLNLGGPETLDDVQPFLFNLFADPDIIRLPRSLRFLQRPLAQFISTLRAPKSQEGYASIGGGSPLRKITMDQAKALKTALSMRDLPAEVYVGMRYWHPFTEEAIYEIKRDGITRLVVLPLYPQFSITTSGSSLRLLERIFREDEYLVNMQHTVIPSWYQRSGYVEAMSDLIEQELVKFPNPNEVNIFFSAHGVPVAYVEEAGDPYKAEMEECIQLIMDELQRRGIYNPHTLAYQSRVGPVEWLKPYTDETIERMGRQGVKSLLAVPISFVSEHIETLEEIDCEYKELAFESGIENWGRVPALNCQPRFIDDLADAVIEALPYVGAMASSYLGARQPMVPLGSVEELLATYDVQRRELPAPVSVWEWGWTKSAETWNGRAAMLAVLALLVLEVTSGQGVLHQWGILPLLR